MISGRIVTAIAAAYVVFCMATISPGVRGPADVASPAAATVTWLNNNAGACQVLLAFALFIVTGYYAYQAWRQADASRSSVEEMRNAREAEAAANVVVYFDVPYGHYIVYFVLRNVGRSPAHDVRLELDPTLSHFPSLAQSGLIPAFLKGAHPVPAARL